MMNIAEALAVHVHNRPGHPAIMAADRVLTYRELYPIVVNAAARLHDAGARRRDLIALALDNTVEHLVLFYAVARLGAAVQPIHHLAPAEEKIGQARAFGATILLVDTPAPSPGGLTVIVIDPSWCGASRADAPMPEFPTDESLPVLLALSSGTTGLPKGPLLTHRQLWHRMISNVINAKMGPHERYLSVISPYFSGGRSFSITTLYFGGTVVIPPQIENAESLVAEAARCRITLMYLVPTMLRRLLTLSAPRYPLLPSLRALVSSGSLIHPDERRAIRERLSPNFHEAYATSEAGIVSSLSADEQVEHPDSVGQPAYGVEVRIVDDDHRPVPPGTIGQLRYRGACVPDSFYRHPEATAAAFHDGWYYPGDLALMSDRGFITLKGRADDLIDRDGVKIRPGDIEAVLLESLLVTEAVVVGVPAANQRQAVVAFAVLEAQASERKLLEFCELRLAPAVLPDRIFVVSEIPRTAIGKIDRVKLRSAIIGRR